MSAFSPWCIAFALAFVVLAAPVQAQEHAPHEGVLHVLDWPASASSPDQLRRYEVLPYLDTLTVGYRYETHGDAPGLSLALEWTPGAYGLLRGRRVAYEQLPDDLRLVALTIRADVYTGGRRVAEWIVSVDSMMLGPRPDFARVDLDGLAWASVFVDTDAAGARTLFDEGFELRNPEVLEAAFAVFETDDEAAPRVRTERRPAEVVVYQRDVFFDLYLSLDWLLAGDGSYRYPAGEVGPSRGDRTGRGRVVTDRRSRSGERTGSAERRSRGDRNGSRSDKRGGKDSRDKDDEDDKNDLLPAALTTAAAVAFVAYAGGTVGYYGNTRYAPIGLAAGFVRPQWGILLQGAVNEALLTSGSGPKHLVVKLLGFGRGSEFPVAPAFGVGLRATDVGEDVTLDPSFSLGAVGTFGPVIVHGAYDVALGGVELGFAFNFRAKAGR